jgi:predicted component of type VI protein secretion system
MQGVNNINELRNLSLRLIDDIIGEKMKVVGRDSEQQILNHVNKQINNVLNITKLELSYAKDRNGKVKFLEYESK